MDLQLSSPECRKLSGQTFFATSPLNTRGNDVAFLFFYFIICINTV